MTLRLLSMKVPYCVFEMLGPRNNVCGPFSTPYTHCVMPFYADFQQHSLGEIRRTVLKCQILRNDLEWVEMYWNDLKWVEMIRNTESTNVASGNPLRVTLVGSKSSGPSIGVGDGPDSRLQTTWSLRAYVHQLMRVFESNPCFYSPTGWACVQCTANIDGVNVNIK